MEVGRARVAVVWTAEGIGHSRDDSHGSRLRSGAKIHASDGPGGRKAEELFYPDL